MEDKISSIEEYVARFPLNTQKQLDIIKETIKKTIPQATEVISYGNWCAIWIFAMETWKRAASGAMQMYPSDLKGRPY